MAGSGKDRRRGGAGRAGRAGSAPETRQAKKPVGVLPSVRDDDDCRRLVTLEADDIGCIPLIGEARFLQRYRDIPLHSHDGCMEITLCLRGNLEYECQGRVYRFWPGDVFTVPPGMLHRPTSYPKGMHRYRLLFRPPGRGRTVLGLARAESDWLVQGVLSLGVGQFADRGDVRDRFQKVFQIFDELPRGTPERKLKLRVAVCDLLLSVVAAAKARPKVLPANRVQRLVAEIRSHPERSYAMDSLSAQLQMSPTALQLRFRHLTGLPPHAFVTECRMESAKRMLADGILVEVVANRLGYASPKHFSGLFRRIVGCAPSKFRA